MMFLNRQQSIQIEQLSDLELVRQYKQTGDHAFFVALYQRYTHLVFGVCLKYLKQHDQSQDAVMEIFEKLMLDLNKHEVQHFKSWLYMVAKNHCLMQLRKKGTQYVELEKVKPLADDVVETIENQHLYQQQFEDEKKLHEAIAQLNDEQKNCVDLFYLQNKSYQEIADSTGFTLNQVKSYIQNGKRNLKIILEKKLATS